MNDKERINYLEKLGRDAGMRSFSITAWGSIVMHLGEPTLSTDGTLRKAIDAAYRNRQA